MKERQKRREKSAWRARHFVGNGTEPINFCAKPGRAGRPKRQDRASAGSWNSYEHARACGGWVGVRELRTKERMADDLPLHLVAGGDIEYNLAKFKENKQNAGRYPSMDDEQLPMRVEGDKATQRLILSAKTGTWEGEPLNQFTRTGFGRSAPQNYYMLVKRDKNKKYGKNGRCIVHLVTGQYLFGRKRDVQIKDVEDQEKEARKEQDRLDRKMEAERSGTSREERRFGRVVKRARRDDLAAAPSVTGDGYTAARDAGSEGGGGGGGGKKGRFTGRFGDDDGTSEFFNYSGEAGAMTNSAKLIRASDFNPVDEAVDFGDENVDYMAGGDNEGMEDDPNAYVDDTGPVASDPSDSEDEEEENKAKENAGSQDENKGDGDGEDDGDDDGGESSDDGGGQHFEGLFGDFHATKMLESNHALSEQDAKEIFEVFLRKNNVVNPVPRGRDDFLRHLTSWDNSRQMRQRLLDTCSKIILLDQEKSTTITLHTVRNIFRRCVGGTGPNNKMTKEAIIDNLKKDVGATFYRQQKSKVDQIFRESLQREADPSGVFKYSLAARDAS